VDLAERKANFHRSEPSLSSLGPNQAHRRARGELLPRLVLSFCFLALRIVGSVISGELGLPGHGATAPEAREPAGRRLVFPGLNRDRRIEDQRPRKKDTSSLRFFLKETLEFLII
jgi:hypothetical protein